MLIAIVDNNKTLFFAFLAFLITGFACAYGCYAVLREKGYSQEKRMSVVPVAFIPVVGIVRLLATFATPQAGEEQKVESKSGMPLPRVLLIMAIIAVLTVIGLLLARSDEFWGLYVVPSYLAIWLGVYMYAKV